MASRYALHKRKLSKQKLFLFFCLLIFCCWHIISFLAFAQEFVCLHLTCLLFFSLQFLFPLFTQLAEFVLTDAPPASPSAHNNTDVQNIQALTVEIMMLVTAMVSSGNDQLRTNQQEMLSSQGFDIIHHLLLQQQHMIVMKKIVQPTSRRRALTRSQSDDSAAAVMAAAATATVTALSLTQSISLNAFANPNPNSNPSLGDWVDVSIMNEKTLQAINLVLSKLYIPGMHLLAACHFSPPFFSLLCQFCLLLLFFSPRQNFVTLSCSVLCAICAFGFGVKHLCKSNC